MSISDKVREAYEDGLRDAQYARDHPMGYLMTGGVRNRPSDPDAAAAYDKGLREEELDDD